MLSVAKSPDAGRSVQAWVDVLNRQTQLIGELVKAAKSKQEAILSGDRVRLEQATTQETELLIKTDGVEGERIALTKQLLGGEGTLEEVLENLPLDGRQSVEESSASLIEAIEELQRLNHLNANLLQHSLGHVQAVLGALTGEGTDTGSYGPGSGRMNRPQSMLDWRA